MDNIKFLEIGNTKELKKIIHLYYIKYLLEKHMFNQEYEKINRESEIINEYFRNFSN